LSLNPSGNQNVNLTSSDAIFLCGESGADNVTVRWGIGRQNLSTQTPVCSLDMESGLMDSMASSPIELQAYTDTHTYVHTEMYAEAHTRTQTRANIQAQTAL